VSLIDERRCCNALVPQEPWWPPTAAAPVSPDPPGDPAQPAQKPDVAFPGPRGATPSTVSAAPAIVSRGDGAFAGPQPAALSTCSITSGGRMAERVLGAGWASGAETAQGNGEALQPPASGWGLVKVRLFQARSIHALIAALPLTIDSGEFASARSLPGTSGSRAGTHCLCSAMLVSGANVLAGPRGRKDRPHV